VTSTINQSNEGECFKEKLSNFLLRPSNAHTVKLSKPQRRSKFVRSQVSNLQVFLQKILLNIIKVSI
jgi:hypothetical protein